MTLSRHLHMVKGPLDPTAALEFCARPDHGAVCLFVGQVRDHHAGRHVSAIDFDAHPALGTALMARLADEAEASIGAPLAIWLEHAYGLIQAGERCIVIAVSSPHRDAGFTACRFLIEAAKTRLPVWKREVYADQSAVWLDGTPLTPL